MLKILPLLLLLALILLPAFVQYQKNKQLTYQVQNLNKDKVTLNKKLTDLQNQDQVKINKQLQEDLKNTHDTYLKSIATYQTLLDLKVRNVKLDNKYDSQFADILDQLSKLYYATAAAEITALNNSLKQENDKFFAADASAVQNAPVNNAAPGSGYSRQTVHTDRGDFVVDMAAGDLNSTRVIVDTASDSDCANNCPLLSLGDYVARSGAYAGVNGSYFCPAEYPSCAGKTNSYDLLVMNKNKHYFNSANNVYSTNPAAIFGNGWARFVGRALEWGRDTNVDAVISNFPLLVFGNNVVFGGDSDPKQSAKGSRGFVANRGNVAYIGVVHNVTVFESALTLKAIGLENAMNLDDGGSAAFWFGGYKVGPGRNLPNAVLFVRK